MAPSINGWSPPQVAIIARGLCGVLDKKSRVTTDDLDPIVQQLMDGPGGSSRADARTYLTMGIAQFCPSYAPVMVKYLAS